MSDLTERLRAAGWTGRNSLPDMAADEIERLQARVGELEQKIDDPSWLDFMEITDNFLAHYPTDIFTGVSGDAGPLFVVALRKAKRALEGDGK